MNIVLNEPLSQVSLLFVSAAMGLLAVALLLFSFQLAKLKDDATETRFEKFGFWVLGIATVVLGVGVMLRGIAANRVLGQTCTSFLSLVHLRFLLFT